MLHCVLRSAYRLEGPAGATEGFLGTPAELGDEQWDFSLPGALREQASWKPYDNAEEAPLLLESPFRGLQAFHDSSSPIRRFENLFRPSAAAQASSALSGSGAFPFTAHPSGQLSLPSLFPGLDESLPEVLASQVRPATAVVRDVLPPLASAVRPGYFRNVLAPSALRPTYFRDVLSHAVRPTFVRDVLASGVRPASVVRDVLAPAFRPSVVRDVLASGVRPSVVRDVLASAVRPSVVRDVLAPAGPYSHNFLNRVSQCRQKKANSLPVKNRYFPFVHRI